MSFFWVQQWVALPIVYEQPMGDLPPSSRPQVMDNAATGFVQQGSAAASPSPSLQLKIMDSSAPFHSQLSNLPQIQQRPDYRSTAYLHAPYQFPEQATSPMSMGAMADALPEYGISDETPVNPNPQSASRALSGASPSAVAYQLGQNVQMPAHANGPVSTHSAFGVGFSATYHQNFMPSQGAQHTNYAAYGANASRLGGQVSMQSPYHNYPPTSQYLYYAAPYGSHNQFSTGFASQGAQAQALYGRGGSLTNTAGGGQVGQMISYAYNDSIYPGVRPGGPGNYQGSQPLDNHPYGSSHSQVSGMPRTGSLGSIPRGPPRKPRQSGHALWVGNLPPGTTVVALKDHFSRDATKDIESLFLISKSNCAFVNYRTETSCTAAMHRFHDSRFNGVRLVCRLRRSSTPASGVPIGPASTLNNQQHVTSRPATPKQDSVTSGLHDPNASSPSHGSNDGLGSTTDNNNKYFIVKSLTLQDLELSVRNGIWATQSHNEEALNKAFESTENVYLIFSANKSGEYFGYARMASAILEDGSRMEGSISQPENNLEVTDVPKSIPTPATEWAPRGKIIDDSARGTIFWEAEPSEAASEEYDAAMEEASTMEGDTLVVAQSWGKPFKIEWISNNRLPFYRTRGLRNPWNANREVKIARDGTELEPSVGERLLQMFHRMGGPTAMSTFGGPVMAQVRQY
ncbi:hypothetical protein T440DRAFT_237605 [Plenodomus tracheiphilus IPT5]|uniref:YTH domain-containing protein n=1 Tax=Plenodomus tracheiphilus IPT5 TaxID=1408161 RepID=A0A6A7BGQ0_9PLEO|nr:hypothetical protein T440DRAFT_237605 [Plenodomus tracheiphilus IPT5]